MTKHKRQGLEVAGFRPGMRLELHLLQSLPPSNINRDDMGSPKDADFGGVRRGRVSSQSWKRAMREYAAAAGLMIGDDAAVRTMQLPLMLRDELWAQGVDSPEADVLAGRAAATLVDKPLADQLEAIFLVGRSEVVALARELSAKRDQYLADSPLMTLEEVAAGDPQQEEVEPEAKAGKKPKKPAKKKKEAAFAPWKGAQASALLAALTAAPSLDVAIHGRMLASRSTLGVDGALQVAHAVGTHAAAREFDYLTAVDELRLDPGAAMIEQVEFGAFTLYRYLCLDLWQLACNLSVMGESEVRSAVSRAVRAVAESAFLSLPGGKRNSFTANTLPGYALAGISSSGVPMSLANAFLEPVQQGEGGYMDVSASRLEGEFCRLQRAYGGSSRWWNLEVLQRAITEEGVDLSAFGVERAESLAGLTESLVDGAEALAARQGQVA